jgi:hypothetical protein
MKKTVLVSFFYDRSSEGLLVDVAMLLEPQFHVPRDILYQAGDCCDMESRENGNSEDWGATTIYFVKSGKVQIQDQTSEFLLCELNTNMVNENKAPTYGKSQYVSECWETLNGGDYFGDNYFISGTKSDGENIMCNRVHCVSVVCICVCV